MLVSVEPGWVALQRENGEVPETDEALALQRVKDIFDAVETPGLVKPMREWVEDPSIWALAFARMGRPVFPLAGLDRMGMCQCQGRVCKTDELKYGKHPFPGTRGHLNATADETTIRAWMVEHPGCNWGTAMREGDVGIDVDPRNGGEDTWATISRGHVRPDAPTVLTGNDGLHLYFTGSVIRQGADVLGPGIDVKAHVDGRTGYFVLPGSRTAGGRYHVLKGGFDSPPPLPEWLHPKPKGDGPKPTSGLGSALHGAEYVATALRDEVAQAAALRDGQGRRNFLFGAARRLGKKFVPPLQDDEIVTALVAAGMHAGLDADEAEPHVRNGLRAGLAQR